jgi:hypothetical protein
MRYAALSERRVKKINRGAWSDLRVALCKTSRRGVCPEPRA